MKKLLITGASGFIGRALAASLAADFQVLGLYHRHRPDLSVQNLTFVQGDLSRPDTMRRPVRDFKPDVVIHGAAIAHQSLGRLDRQSYFAVNSHATESLARIAAEAHPEVQFFFLSTISVYGEQNLALPVTEDHPCRPTGDYGLSKLDAENRLLALTGSGLLKHLAILRLAPVYDRTWSYNLDRRIFGPLKLAYIRFGSGKQQMSALARSNLVDFMTFCLREDPGRFLTPSVTLNICDHQPYSFWEMIDVYRKSMVHPDRPVVPIPLFVVFGMTRILGRCFPRKKQWCHAVYDKLARSLVFDPQKMLATGFVPKHTLTSELRPAAE